MKHTAEYADATHINIAAFSGEGLTEPFAVLTIYTPTERVQFGSHYSGEYAVSDAIDDLRTYTGRAWYPGKVTKQILPNGLRRSLNKIPVLRVDFKMSPHS